MHHFPAPTADDFRLAALIAHPDAEELAAFLMQRHPRAVEVRAAPGCLEVVGAPIEMPPGRDHLAA